MKKILFISLIATALLFACNNNPSASHTHEDGTECDHDHEKASHTEQEAFEVDADSTEDFKHDSLNATEEHEHHQEGDDHDHSH